MLKILLFVKICINIGFWSVQLMATRYILLLGVIPVLLVMIMNEEDGGQNLLKNWNILLSIPGLSMLLCILLDHPIRSLTCRTSVELGESLLSVCHITSVREKDIGRLFSMYSNWEVMVIGSIATLYTWDIWPTTLLLDSGVISLGLMRTFSIQSRIINRKDLPNLPRER